MPCTECSTRVACNLWGCRLMTRHPENLTIPDPVRPLPEPAPAPAPAPRQAATPGARSYVVREVANGWILTPCLGVTLGAEHVAVAPEGAAELLRAWCAERG